MCLEQAAHSFLRVHPPMARKYALHLILAGHRFAKSSQVRRTLTLQNSLSVCFLYVRTVFLHNRCSLGSKTRVYFCCSNGASFHLLLLFGVAGAQCPCLHAGSGTVQRQRMGPCRGMHICMYVYVCMYVCTHVRMYVCMYVCMYVRMYVCVYVCTRGMQPIFSELH